MSALALKSADAEVVNGGGSRFVERGMLPALCTFALLAAAAPLPPGPASPVIPWAMWPDEKVIASTTPQTVEETSFTVEGGTIVDIDVAARVWRPGFGALIELNAPVIGVLDEGLLTLPAGSKLFVYAGTVLVMAPGATLNGHRLHAAFELRSERVGLDKDARPTGALNHAVWIDPVEVAGWQINEFFRDSRTMVLAKPHVHRGVTLPAGATVRNLLGVGGVLSTWGTARDGSVVEHRWVQRPNLELHLVITSAAATLAVTVDGRTTTRRGRFSEGTFEWTAQKTHTTSGVTRAPAAFTLRFDEDAWDWQLTGALPSSDECELLNWTRWGDIACHVDGGHSVVPAGPPPASFPAALVARLQVP